MNLYAKYGVTQFRNDHISPMKGRIKEQPCHFVVKEINLEGRVAGTSSEIHNVANILQAVGGRKKKPRGNVLPSQKSEASQASMKTVEHSSDIIDWDAIKVNPEKHLLLLIGDEKMNLLHELSTTLSESNKEVLLGIFELKKDRSILHQCVRQCFPSLKSMPFKKKGESNDHDEVTWIRCFHDPSHADLVKIGVSEKLVSELMVYINCRLLRGTMEKEEPILLKVPDLEKSSRSRLHHYLQKHYGKFLESKTLGKTSSTISVRFKARKSSKLKRRREEVYGLVLQKTNMELLNVLGHLAKELDIDMNRIRYAGIKDKVAVTTQFLTVSGVSLSDIEEVCKMTSRPQWSVQYDPIVPVGELQLGDLAGNQFEIIVRDLKCDQGKLLHFYVFYIIFSLDC